MSVIASRIPVAVNARLLSLRNVGKSFSRGLARALRRTRALSDVCVELSAGEIVAINGVEGAGKSTLLQCAAGLLRIDSGEVRWFGDVFPGGGIVPGVAFVPAVPVFYPFLTVRDVLAYRAARDLSPRDDPGSVIKRALRLLRLTDFASRKVVTLTRAEAKRLALAEALASGARAILLDTCTSDMSAAVGETTCQALESFAAEGGAALVALRDAAPLARVATRLILLAEGRVSPPFVRADSVEDAVTAFTPGSRFVAERLH